MKLAAPRHAPWDVFRAFLRLGLTAFGGPTAHIGYFRREFVVRRAWLSDSAYAEIVGFCQFLPGPASSQSGFAIGWYRAGLPGALAAWAGFTLPSALLMGILGGLPALASLGIAGNGVVHGLQLVAVAVIAHAVLGMARTLTPDRARAGIALAAMVLVTLLPVFLGQIVTLILGAGAGLALCRSSQRIAPQNDLPPSPVSRPAAMACLAAFATLLIVPSIFAEGVNRPAVFAAFYRCGALVFGGGHVVLPLLKDAVVAQSWLSSSRFLAGYGIAQAMPGPLFTLAAYLGASLPGDAGGVRGACLSVVAIFLPGLLLVPGLLPFWHAVRRKQSARAALRGINAAVVGILAHAFYTPVLVSAVLSPADFAAALAGFVLLLVWRAPPLLVVCLGAAYGACSAWAAG